MCCCIRGRCMQPTVKRCAHRKSLVLTLSVVRSLFTLAQSSTHDVDTVATALVTEAAAEDVAEAPEGKVCAPRIYSNS